ncbi:hypothetical protein FQA39_LY05968 [Lamprigera yunnana]|nr:hypothetical protein FQA39_LY05968 [Lamprigera yunnana]
MSFAFKLLKHCNKGLLTNVTSRCLSTVTRNATYPVFSHSPLNNWIYRQPDPVISPRSIIPQIKLPNDFIWTPRSIEPDLKITQIDEPLNAYNHEKLAARLITIRRKKMKKHKLKKLRKKLKYKRAKVRLRRELKKERDFQAVLIAQCKKGEAFSAEEYVASRLKEYTKPPTIPFYLTDEYKELVRRKQLRLNIDYKNTLLEQSSSVDLISLQKQESDNKMSYAALLGKEEDIELDSVSSGESLIKCYCFDVNQYDSSTTEKCLAFWKAILQQKELKPMECTFRKTTHLLNTNEEIETEAFDYDNFEELGVINEPEEREYMWYKILLDLRKRNMDKTAMAATGYRCKLCDTNLTKLSRCPNNLDEQLGCSDNLSALNSWLPTSGKETKHLPDKSQEKKIEIIFPCTKETCKRISSAVDSIDSVHSLVTKIEDTKEVKKFELPLDKERKFSQQYKCKCTGLCKCKFRSPTEKSLTPLTFENKLHFSSNRSIDLADDNDEKCDICKNLNCKCEKYFEEAANEVATEVAYELEHLRKDKACTATPEEIALTPTELKFCSSHKERNVCNLMDEKPQMQKTSLPIKEDLYLETIFQSTQEYRSTSGIKIKALKSEKDRSVDFKSNKVSYVPKLLPELSAVSEETIPIVLHQEDDDEDSEEQKSEKSEENSFLKPMLWYVSDMPQSE